MRHPKMLIEFMQLYPTEVQAYLGEYCYRLNRREQRHDLCRRVLNRCMLYTGPVPYSLLTAT